MKNLCLSAAIFLVTAAGNAQVQYYYFGGPQISTANYKVNDSKQNTSLKPGIQAGVGIKVPVEYNIYFAPVIFYSLKGYKVSLDSRVFPPDPEASNNNVSMHTVEVGALVRVDLSDNPNRYFISLGPSLDIQIKGKEKFILMTGESVNKNMQFSFGDYGRYSIAAIARVGYERKDGWMIFAQYNLGLGNINNADNGPNILHRVFGISLGKYLNR